MNRVVLAVVLAFVTSCTKRNPEVCCTTAEDCAAKGLPDGTSCAEGLFCINNRCEAPQACQANSDCSAPTAVCTPDGTCGECVDSSTCGNGVCDESAHVCRGCLDSSTCGEQVCDAATYECRDCSSDDECASGFCSPATHSCKGATITPRYLPTICDTPATTPLNITLATTLDTSTAAMCSGGIVTQLGGPEICVVHHTTITIASAGSLRATGSRALALVADTDLDVSGTIDVSADGTNSGPGGDIVGSGGSALVTYAGGGGAGFKTPGGAGGTQADGGAVNGGASRDAVAATTFLAGARSGASDAVGHGGGGGGGGAGGRIEPSDSAPHGGWGGGSGGHVLLQGRAISVTGQLFANGGSGGSGRPSIAPGNGLPGDDGLRSVTCPLGGGPGTKGGGGGGSGGCLGQAPSNGGGWSLNTGANQQSSGGGGGGSVGFLQALAPAGVSVTVTPSIASPAFEPAGTVATH